MDGQGRRGSWLVWGALALGAAASAQPAASPADGARPPARLASLSRVLARFDFEEAERAPYTMPLKFYRHIAPDQGFPKFGRMQLSRDAAHGGGWSFEFELDGGSLSAQVPTAVIPAMPGTDYVITGWIRTEGLEHASACIVAQLYDAHRNAIPESRARSRLLRTHGGWRQVSIEIFGDFDDVADLVVELQVLQPQQFKASSRRAGEPLLEDVEGRAWFDDVVVRQQPRIELTTNAPGNVVIAPAKPTLHVMIRDPTPEPLVAQLKVLDLDGRAVRERTDRLPQGSWRRVVNLDGLASGWYRAVVEVANEQGVVGRRSLDLAVLPPRGPHRDPRFGVVLSGAGTGGTAAVTRHLLRHLGVSSALVALWDDIETPPSIETGPLRGTIDELRANGVEVTLALPGLARKLARQPTLDFTEPPPDGQRPRWQAALQRALMSFGLDVPRWLIGAPAPAAESGAPPNGGRAALSESFELAEDGQSLEIVTAAASAFGTIVPNPIILAPWPAEYEPADLPAPHGHWITVPYHVPPESIGHYATRWSRSQGPLFVTFERLPAGRYGPHERAVDLMLRGLYGWRAGLPRMAITAPWDRDKHHGSITPNPAYPVWRALADRLHGRRFAGELDVAEGVRCWILAGPDTTETALVIWTEQAVGEQEIRLLLSAGPVDVVDAFGNVRAVAPRDGAHTLVAGPRPVFIEGADAGIASFRKSFRIAPSYLTARHQVHECELVVGNPWDTTIAGTVRLRPPAGWRITPRIHPFSIGPGGQASFPLSVIFNQRAPTGPAQVEADVHLIAEGKYRLRMTTRLEVGMPDIEFAAFWRVADNPAAGTTDLIITEHVTNNGERPVHLRAYVSAPQMSQQRRTIGELLPGQTAVRSIRLIDGARLLAGRHIRVGVIDAEGARLNRVMPIPSAAVLAGAGDS